MSEPARALAVFALTYLLISGWELHWFPVNRPAGALLGAVLMVLLGVLTPSEAYAAVHLDTIALLLGTMILSEYLKVSGFYAWIAHRLSASRLTPAGLLGAVSVVAASLSALLVNDTVCLMLTPLLLALVEAAALPPVPFLVALATSSNLGSALTLTGNPQNMIVGTLSGLPYLRYAALVAIPVVVSLLANYILLRIRYGAALARPRAAAATPPPAPPLLDRPLLAQSIVAVLLVIVGFAAAPATGLGLAWTAVAGAALLLASGRRDPYAIFAGVDWTLLVFFSGLFVVIGGLAHTGLLREAEERFLLPLAQGSAVAQTLHLGWITVLGSQLFSNVPFVIVTGHAIPGLPSPDLAWVTLAYVSTVAGNLTILGSVANVIVLEQARASARIGFVEYLRFGALTTAVSVAVGVAAILAEHALGWV